ncbi:DUF3592 domain-containing protein [Pseudomonas sp. NPDC008258]|uniref:DUF3592 domain-containing protein n=1 Tax=Pseudomonas sp. NPDC008258 TaxID=3364418 RepID=UPI0036EF3567
MALKYFSAFVLLVGLGLLLVGASHYMKTKDFLTHSTTTTGRVIALESSDTGDQVKLRVRFLDHTSSAVEFTSSVSNSSAYAMGDHVELVFLKNDSQVAKLKDFKHLWENVVDPLALGSLFTLIGWLMVRKRRRSLSSPYDFQQCSEEVEEEVEADIYHLVCDHRITVDGQHPFVVICHWRDPKTNQLHELISDEIYFNPAPYLAEDTVRAVINHRDPNKSYLDLSFLPKSVA